MTLAIYYIIINNYNYNLLYPCDLTVVICYLIWPCDIDVRITYLISHSSSFSYNTVMTGYFQVGCIINTKLPSCVDIIRGTSLGFPSWCYESTRPTDLCFQGTSCENLMMYSRLYQHTRVVLYMYHIYCGRIHFIGHSNVVVLPVPSSMGFRSYFILFISVVSISYLRVSVSISSVVGVLLFPVSIWSVISICSVVDVLFLSVSIWSVVLVMFVSLSCHSVVVSFASCFAVFSSHM